MRDDSQQRSREPGTDNIDRLVGVSPQPQLPHSGNFLQHLCEALTEGEDVRETIIQRDGCDTNDIQARASRR